MKRLTVVSVALLLAGLLARPAAAQSVEVGLLGGASFATLEFEDADFETNSTTGFNIGALLQVPIAEIISIQPEIHYVQKGGAFAIAQEEESALELGYIQIPLLARVDVPTESRINFAFLLGPEIAFRVSCERELAAADEAVECGDDEIENIDYGLLVGGSLGYSMPWGEIFLDGRYDLGLTSITSEDSQPAFLGDGEVKNRAIYVLVGFTVPLGGM